MERNPLSKIRVISFGFKHGAPPSDANIVMDVRFVTNPYYDETLRPLTGQDAPVQEFLRSQPETHEALAALRLLLSTAVPNYVRNASRYVDTFTIALGCTGGKHRSRFFAEQVADMVRELTSSLGLATEVVLEHRDQGKDD
ncbi:MAG: RapZ C-terminal domain-containing protein [Terriglobales bacterium]